MTRPTNSARAAESILTSHTFTAPLWATPGEGGWVFVTLPLDLSDSIRSMPREPTPGFGSLRVEASLGTSIWKTSIFPDAKSHSYLLPVKKAIRATQGLDVPGVVAVSIVVLD